ncbi:ABC transporter ATP-binding protein [Microbacterium sp.]|uniref:ABC transporter ATP-binding protein n=1 Tax=Microbacterium sp. TaxID=51671 RepID=UPI0039E5D117
MPSPQARAAGLGEPLLTARGLVVGRTHGIPAAGPLDVDVRGGEVLGITGRNGAGKSTLALTLAGLLPAHGGEVTASATLVGDLRVRRGRVDDPFAWSSRALLTRIGTVLQDPEHQLLGRTVRGELEVGPRALGLPDAEIARRVDELLQRLRLTALAEANPYTLSGGQKRRLTVGAMLATRPRVMVLDEPTFGQDAVTWAEIVALVAEVRDDGAGVVVVTHDDAVLSALSARELPVAPADLGSQLRLDRPFGGETCPKSTVPPESRAAPSASEPCVGSTADGAKRRVDRPSGDENRPGRSVGPAFGAPPGAAPPGAAPSGAAPPGGTPGATS